MCRYTYLIEEQIESDEWITIVASGASRSDLDVIFKFNSRLVFNSVQKIFTDKGGTRYLEIVNIKKNCRQKCHHRYICVNDFVFV